MRALQRKIRLLFMIKQGRLPFVRGVARITMFRLACFCELSAVDIFVTSGTGSRRGSKRGFTEFSAWFGGLVTFITLQFHVSADEGERRLRMIEPREINPRFHGMARLASLGSTPGPFSAMRSLN